MEPFDQLDSDEPKLFPVRTALLVDADPSVEAIFSTAFKPGSWIVQHAGDNLAALNLAHSRSFDLILTSQRSSGADDVRLLSKIRLARPHTRLIILAHESTPQDVIASMRAHAFSYFSQPIDMDILTEMIRLAAEGPTWDDGIEIISATPEWIRLMARCDMRTADRVVHFIGEVAELPEEERISVGMASREMLMNAIEHGAKMDPTKYFELAYVRGKNMVMCRVKDPGEGFTLDEIPHSAVANPNDDPMLHMEYRQEQGMRPGGYGVLLAQRLVDELIYNQQGNEVLLVKYLSQPTAGSASSSPSSTPEGPAK
jgi:anti-sigma regulatory factor (Ser/Thr protein kinase)/ActR/RegA family two-component response regulator